MSETAATDLDQLKQDLDQLKLDLSELKDHLAEFGSQQAVGIRAQGEAKIMALRDEVDRVAGDLQLQGRETVARVEQAVQERPLTSLLAAFGVGMLLSRLLERRR